MGAYMYEAFIQEEDHRWRNWIPGSREHITCFRNVREFNILECKRMWQFIGSEKEYCNK